MSERGKRRWVLRADAYDSEAEFRDAVASELAGMEHIGHRLGGGFVSSPLRRAIEHDELTEYVTVGWLFEHTFVPAVRAQPVAQPLSEEEMAEHFPEQEPVGAEAT